MAQILLYTDDAGIDEATLDALREHDVFPIKVSDPDAVRLVPIPVAVEHEHLPVVFQAAMRAIKFNSLAHDTFGKELATLLSEDTPRCPTP